MGGGEDKWTMAAELPRSPSLLPRDEGSHSLGDDDTNYFDFVTQPIYDKLPFLQQPWYHLNVIFLSEPSKTNSSLLTTASNKYSWFQENTNHFR